MASQKELRKAVADAVEKQIRLVEKTKFGEVIKIGEFELYNSAIDEFSSIVPNSYLDK